MSQSVLSHRDLLKRLGTLLSIAAYVGIKHEAVRAWASRNVIPPAYWPGLVTLAKEQGIKGVTESAIGLMSHGKPASVAAEYVPGAAYDEHDLI